MKDHAPTGPVCRTCAEVVLDTRDGTICGCTGLSRPGPGSVALRGLRTLGALRRRGKSGLFMMREG